MCGFISTRLEKKKESAVVRDQNLEKDGEGQPEW